VTESNVNLQAIEPEIRAIIDNRLADVTSITERVINDELTTF